MVGANLSTGFSEIFSHEHTPDMPVAMAIRISMSIPLFFTAIRQRNQIYVDGGIFDNYPIKLFDRRSYVSGINKEIHTMRTKYYDDLNEKQSTANRYIYNKETLGIRLDSSKEIKMFKERAIPQSKIISDMSGFIVALVEAMMNVQNNSHLHSNDWQRTIYVDTLNVGAIDFELEEPIKKGLYGSGRKGGTNYFEWYDSETSNPINTPSTGIGG